jgi:hypothetical protein
MNAVSNKSVFHKGLAFTSLAEAYDRIRCLFKVAANKIYHLADSRAKRDPFMGRTARWHGLFGKATETCGIA